MALEETPNEIAGLAVIVDDEQVGGIFSRTGLHFTSRPYRVRASATTHP